MTTTSTYLTFNGNCREAFEFYKSVFGGEFNYIGEFGEMPPQEGYTVPESDKHQIMHVSLPIGNSILMGSDTGSEMAHTFKVGNNITISAGTDTKEEAEKIFAGLSAGGRVTMPMDQTFWSPCFGMLTDKFDINWMISVNDKQ